uniref:IS256 family transposase n=1 Tax=Candidatus Nitrospira inopinata TaxID=1715989 RepID=UPI0013010D16|nr:transposase [Candidatus Nitrospira inopinata]
MYLHGLALGDFELALRGLLGEGAPVSPAALHRLKAQWQHEYEAWKRRRLDELEVVYVWADGLSVKAGLEAGKAALLVVIGALTDGRKVVLAVESGQRKSKESWGAVLRDLRTRGLKPWRCTIADGHLGIWAALAEQQPSAAEQRCWNHRILNVLDAIPKKHQTEASTLLKAMPYAEAHVECERLRDQFSRQYRTLASKAVERSYAAGSGSSRFISSRRSTGAICARRTSSSRPSPPCGCGRRRARVQTRGFGHGLDLESPAGRGADRSTFECAQIAPGRVCRHAVCGWSPEPSRHSAGGRCLIPFPHLLTRPPRWIIRTFMPPRS